LLIDSELSYLYDEENFNNMNKQQTSTFELRSKQNHLLELKADAVESVRHIVHVPHGLDRYYEYERSLMHTLAHGMPKFDRTGTDTIGVHGYQSRFNLDDGFPLVTTKQVHMKSIIHELLWLVRGETNIKYLVENGVSIWTDWPLKHFNQSQEEQYSAKGMGHHDNPFSIEEFHEKIVHAEGFAEKWGELGPVYGKQWRNWSGFKVAQKGYWKNENPTDRECSPPQWIPEVYEEFSMDQLGLVEEAIKKQHATGVISRRMIISAWNVADIPAMITSGLPPCHCLFQFHSRLMTLNERLKQWAKMQDLHFSSVENMTDDMLDAVNAPAYELDLQLYQRSCDIFLGVPFNIASYSLLLMMMAQVTNTKAGSFIHDYGDLHIYSNHLDQVVEQLSRAPFPYPTMKIVNRGQKIDEFTYDDFLLENYQSHSKIKAKVAV
jgi:thymidylate synthase